MTDNINNEILNELLLNAKQIIKCDNDKKLLEEINEFKEETYQLEKKINKSKLLYSETEELKKEIGDKISNLNNLIFSKRSALIEKFGG